MTEVRRDRKLIREPLEEGVKRGERGRPLWGSPSTSKPSEKSDGNPPTLIRWVQSKLQNKYIGCVIYGYG